MKLLNKTPLAGLTVALCASTAAYAQPADPATPPLPTDTPPAAEPAMPPAPEPAPPTSATTPDTMPADAATPTTAAPPAAEPAAPSTATATPPAATPATPAAPAQAGAPTDLEVSQFAQAYSAVMEVQESSRAELEAAPAEQRAALQQQMQANMQAAVSAAGLSPERFNAIAQAAQTDTALAGRIQAAMAARSAAPDSES